jgi:hypothetical protein
LLLLLLLLLSFFLAKSSWNSFFSLVSPCLLHLLTLPFVCALACF